MLFCRVVLTVVFEADMVVDAAEVSRAWTVELIGRDDVNACLC